MVSPSKSHGATHSMCESFYNFQQSPFSNQPEPGSIYFGEKHKAALATLQHGLNDPVGITVLTGPAGAGKTTLLQYLRSTIKTDYAMGIDFTIGFISNTPDFGGQLSQGLLATYGLNALGKSESESYMMLRKYLINECYKKNRQPYLVIDQAESINTRTMDEVGRLASISAYRGKSLQFILAGREHLMTVLRLPCSEHIARRIGQLFVLNPLDLNETTKYIQYRLNAAGADGKIIFNAAACNIVYELSKGIPRIINNLCGLALEQGYQNQRSILDETFIDQVLRGAHRSKDAEYWVDELESLDVAEMKKQGESDGKVMNAKKGSIQTTVVELEASEWRVSNPWDNGTGKTNVFELRPGIGEDSQSTGGMGSGGALELQGVFPENPVVRVLKRYKKSLYGLLILLAGALFGFLIAVYVSGIRSDSTTFEISTPGVSQESVVLK